MYTFGPLIAKNSRSGRLLGGAPVTVTTLDGTTLDTYTVDEQPLTLVTNHEGYAGTFTADTDQRVILARPRGGDPLPLYAHEGIHDAAEAADTINTGRLSEDALMSTIDTRTDQRAGVMVPPLVQQAMAADPTIAQTVAAAVTAEATKGGLFSSVTPEMFGAAGNGTDDDTAAVQAMFTHLAGHGGHGSARGTYRITTPIVVQNAPKGFTFTGMGPETTLLWDGTTSESAITMRVISKMKLVGFQIRSKEGATPMSSGIAVRGGTDNIFEDITVVGYTNFPINVFSGDGVTARNNAYIRCIADGLGIASNGFMQSNAETPLMDNCEVYNLDPAGSPAYGLQFKNSCKNGTIRGGIVDGARGGVVFGSDTDGSINEGHTVTGVKTRNCDRGFLASNTINTEVDMQIDMGDRDAGPAVQIISGCDNLRVTATIDNLHPAATAVTVASSNCEVIIPRMNKYGANLVHFGADTSSIVRANVPSQHLKYTRGTGATVGLNPPNLTGTTGWRGIQALITGYTEVASVTRIRRVGDDVEMRLQVRNPTAPGTVQMLTLPEGFRPDWTVSGPLLVMAQNTPGANIQVTTAGAVTAYAATAHTGWGFADLRWKTADAWPETLPGIAL